jgi:hypothetical protein
MSVHQFKDGPLRTAAGDWPDHVFLLNLYSLILVARNVPLVEIKYMLRHTSLATTQRYIHRLKKENREVLAALPGLKDSETKSTSKVHHQALGL